MVFILHIISTELSFLSQIDGFLSFKSPKSSDLSENLFFCGQNRSKSAKIGQNRSKLVKIGQNWSKSVKFGQNRSKLVEIGQNSSKLVKIGQNRPKKVKKRSK